MGAGLYPLLPVWICTPLELLAAVCRLNALIRGELGA
jgi:hypothetical protein